MRMRERECEKGAVRVRISEKNLLNRAFVFQSLFVVLRASAFFFILANTAFAVWRIPNTYTAYEYSSSTVYRRRQIEKANREYV